MKGKLKVVDKSKTILVKVHSSNEDVMTCSFGILPLSKVLIAKIKKLRGIFVKENAKYENIISKLSSYDLSLDWLTEEENSEDVILSDEMQEELGKAGVDDDVYAFINDKFYKDNSGKNLPLINADIPYLEVTNMGFKFSTYIKHTLTKLDTGIIPFSAIGIEPII